MWEGTDGSPLNCFKIGDSFLQSIIDIKAKNYAIVLQTDDNTIFMYDAAKRNSRIISKNISSKKIIPIALEDHYEFLEQDNARWQIISLADIYQLLFSLHFDQIRLLRWIYQAAIKHQRLNLTGYREKAIIHARKAYKALPKRIKQITKEFVLLHKHLPEQSENCVIC